MNDVHRPIDICEWQNEILEVNKLRSLIIKIEERKTYTEAVHHRISTGRVYFEITEG